MDVCLWDPEDLEDNIKLMPHQLEAMELLDNGRILYGGVGAGKSATALGYYLRKECFRQLIVITTAKKRDSLEWLGEAAKFGIGLDDQSSITSPITIDSWNNLGKYEHVENAFFIFDEQRLVGHGAWVRSFIKISRRNHWILLSATPGDTWLDYAPVFIANGFYKNITDFKRQHVVYAPYVKFPKVVRYLGEAKLERLRNEILVEMPYLKHTERVINWMYVGYDKDYMNQAVRMRWNVYEKRPIVDIAEMYRVMRKIVNTDPSRLECVRFLLKFHPRLIVFYNFDYELEILRGLADEVALSEWNGHRHEPIPPGDSWVYLVQYVAGSESWNCTSTDAMVLYSLTYSYKNYVQSQGRIDRLDTPYTYLYYYVLCSDAKIDEAVKAAIVSKKNFNERTYAIKDPDFRQLISTLPGGMPGVLTDKNPDQR